MRILHAIHSLNPAHGGTTYGLLGLVQCLLDRKHETAVLVLDEPGSAWLKDWPCEVYAAGSGQGNYGYNPRFAELALQHFREFDCVIVHGLWQYHGVASRRACMALGVPYAVFPHGMLDQWFAGAYPLKHLQKQLYWWACEYRVLRDAGVTFFTTEAELQSARHTFWPFRVSSAIAPFGIAPPRESPAVYRDAFCRHHPSLSQKRVILFMGRLHHKKGCDILIEGFARWLGSLDVRLRAQWHLRLVGPREDHGFFKHLQSLAGSHGLVETGALDFVDAVTGDRKWQELARAESLILPSHQENFGVVIAEALACGTPVLISDKVNGCHNMAEQGAALVEPDTVQGVVNLFQRWAALTDSERDTKRQAATRYFDRAMSAEVSTDAVIEALQRLTRRSA